MKKYIFIIILLLAISYTPYATLAQIQLETGLPNVPRELPAENALPNYIKYLFIFGLSSITILALAQMIIGGTMYILAAGNAAKVEDAKDTIFQALLGVGVLLISYLLLRTINPDLVNLRNPNLKPIQFQGGGEKEGGGQIVGGGGETYFWTTVPMNKYCADILGANYRDVDANKHCAFAKPEGANSCCGYFPPKE